MTRRRWVRFAPFAVLAAGALAGCSSDDTTRSGSIPLSTSGIATSTTATSTTATSTTGSSTTGPSVASPTVPGATVGSSEVPDATDVPDATVATVAPTPSGPPDPAQFAFTEIGTMSNPLDLTYRTGDDALYIVSQDGFVVAMRGGVVNETKLLDISADITSGGERGLLGLTFSADGSHAYVDYTNADGDTEITEYAVGADGVFDPSTKRLLLGIDQPYSNHNGGQVRIGPDGFLYIGMGDGGSAGDPNRNGLDTSSLLGKILRIDPTPGGDSPYTIPADNPFVGVDGARPEIFSVGVRNPFRYSFDLVTNDLWIADVGQNQFEEVDVAYAADGGGNGANYGWSAFEATHRYNTDQPEDGVTPPIFEYPHGPLGCSISGGVRSRGTALPSISGWYVYGDYCSGQVRAFPVLDDGTAGDEVTLAADLPSISEVAQGPDGELYVLCVDSGKILAVAPAG